MVFGFFIRRDKKEQEQARAAQQAHQAPTPIPAQTQSSVPAQPVSEARTEEKKPVYCFIDSSNMFWGGRESLGFKINYQKLREYLEQKHGVTKIYYYAGVRIFDFEYSILDKGKIDLRALYAHLKQLQTQSEPKEVLMIQKSLDKINFYQKLEEFGYDMQIKPAKVFFDEDDDNQEKPMLKANCDVDMTFDMMRLMEQYSGVVAMTGDGDFTAVLNYLKNHGRTLFVIGRQQRTAKEIRDVSGDNFIDFESLKNIVELQHEGKNRNRSRFAAKNPQ